MQNINGHDVNIIKSRNKTVLEQFSTIKENAIKSKIHTVGSDFVSFKTMYAFYKFELRGGRLLAFHDGELSCIYED